MMFIRELFPRSKSCLECRKTLLLRNDNNQSNDLIEKLEKFIIHMTKVLWGIQECHPICYIEFLQSSLEFTFYYCFTDAGQPYVFTRFVIQCLNIMKTSLIHQNYRAPLGIQTEDESVLRRELASKKSYEIKGQFFTKELLKEIIMWLVTRYFLLTNEDLELWNNDPENFAIDDSRDSWKYNIGACTESLFLSFFSQFSDDILPILVELVQKHYQPVHPNNWEGILLKDAVYLAVGLAASELYDDVDFDQWFSTTLKQELEVNDINYKIIKRRVCWLIGKWTRVKLSSKLRPELYKMMVKALGPNEDLVVRIEASNTLKQALDDFQFNSEEFSPFIETTFTLLFNLLREASECDTKMQILYVLSFMIEHVGDDIKPFIGPFSSYLPSLWQISEDHNMLKCAIISTLVHYVKALGPESSVLEPLIVGMVGLSCDLNQDAHVYLLEDGLVLWLALLENAQTPTQGIMDLLGYMPSLLEVALDQVTIKPAFCIIEAYILLNPQVVIGQFGSRIVEGFISIMSDFRRDDATHLMALLDIILQVSPDEGPHVLQKILIKIFKVVYNNEAIDLNVPESMYVIARVLLTSRDIFSQILTQLAAEIGPDKTSEIILAGFIDAWLEKISWDVKQLEPLKLLALALCSLLNSASPAIVVQKFPNIITSIVECLNDLNSSNESSDQPPGFIE